MSPLRLKARGGAGSKISLPPPSISPPLTCKILQERRALRKLLGSPPLLADHSRKPSLLPARRVPINSKESARQKKVPAAAARLGTAPSRKHAPGHSFKKPFNVGHGASTSSIAYKGSGSGSAAFRGAIRVRTNPNVNVGSRKPDVLLARLNKASACRILQNKAVEKHLPCMLALKCVESEKKTLPTQQIFDSHSTVEACEGFMLSNMHHPHNVELNEEDCNTDLKEGFPVWFVQDSPSNFKSNYDRDIVHSKEEAPVCCEQDSQLTFDADYDRDPELPLSIFSLSNKPRIIATDASDILCDICTVHSIASSQEFYVADSCKKTGGKVQTGDEVILDSSCKHRTHRCANLQECDDCQSSRIGSKKPQGSDLNEGILTSENHGKGDACASVQQNDDDACIFGFQGKALLWGSEDSRCWGNMSSKLRSPFIEQTAFESPWSDADTCEVAVHEVFADYQEMDDADSSGNAWVSKHDSSLLPKMLSIQVNSSNINNAAEKDKHVHNLQEKLALLEDSVSNLAANLKVTSGQLNAKIDDNVLLLSCIQNKLSSIEGLVTRMEAFNCEDLRN